MYPHYQPIDFRSNPPVPYGHETRFFPFLGVPFLAGIAGGLLGGALAFGFGRPYYPYPYGPYGGGPYGGGSFGGGPYGGGPFGGGPFGGGPYGGGPYGGGPYGGAPYYY